MSAEELPLEAESPKWTEKTVLDAIEPRYRKSGNGGSGEYAFMRQVRNAAGFDASRTFDAVAVHLWPSRGFTVDIIEVKVSRSDWLRELRDPAKAEAAHLLGDRFIVAAPAGIVQTGELPPGWGLIEVTPKRSRVAVQATAVKRKRSEFPAGFVIAMLRAAGAAATETSDDRIVRARVADEVARVVKGYEQAARESREQAQKEASDALTFIQAARLEWEVRSDPKAAAAKVRQAIAADRDRAALLDTLRHQSDRLSRMIADLEGDES